MWEGLDVILLALKMEKESQVKECEQPLETGKGKNMRYPPRASREEQSSSDTLIFF